MAFSFGLGKSNLNSKTKEKALLKKSGLNEDMFFWLHAHFFLSVHCHFRLYEKTEKGFQEAGVVSGGTKHELFYRTNLEYNGKRRTSVTIPGYIYGMGEDELGLYRTGYVMGIDEIVDADELEMARVVLDTYGTYPFRNTTYLWKAPQWVPLQSHPQYWFDSFSIIRQIWDQEPYVIDLSADEFREYIDRVDNGESSESESEQEEEESKKPTTKREAARKRLAMKRKEPSRLTKEEVERQTEQLHEDAEFI